MINAWSLAHDVLNGTIDEVYPIMNNFSSDKEGSERLKQNGGYEYTPLPDPDDPKNYPDFRPDSAYVYESPDGGKTVTRRRSGSLEKEVIVDHSSVNDEQDTATDEVIDQQELQSITSELAGAA